MGSTLKRKFWKLGPLQGEDSRLSVTLKSLEDLQKPSWLSAPWAPKAPMLRPPWVAPPLGLGQLQSQGQGGKSQAANWLYLPSNKVGRKLWEDEHGRNSSPSLSLPSSDGWPLGSRGPRVSSIEGMCYHRVRDEIGVQGW